MFKVGDRVQCIDAPSAFSVQVNGIYTVESIDTFDYKITVKEVDGSYYARRFVLLKNESPFQEWETLAMGVQV